MSGYEGAGKEAAQTSTNAERLSWMLLRDRRMAGYKFRRQVVTGPYIVDFACLEAGLVVEADGGQHLVNVRNDRVRTEYPESSGYRVMRFWNHDILRDTQVVMGCIHRFLIELPDSE